MKIYTKMGDGGQTMLATGDFVPKHSLRICAYGTVDELNSFVGVLACSIDEALPANEVSSLTPMIHRVQNQLFDLGAELATPDATIAAKRIHLVNNDSIEALEKEIDLWAQSLAPLRNFVLPGGHATNAHAHVCRTVCRRAERMVLELNQSSPQRPEVIKFLNRLSDWFFQLARYCSFVSKTNEIQWNSPQKPRPSP
jgi:cob(I)alamin adenosyltransferase